jgi:predicted membrane protein
MSSGRLFFGIILIVIGAIFILDRFYIFHHYFIFDFWPVLLIAVGIYLIVRKRKRNRTIEEQQQVHIQSGTTIKKYSKTFGDLNLVMKDSEVDGLKCNTVFGDCSINLADARLKPGVNTIDVSGVFGDVTIIVPSTMEAKAYASCTFGDIYLFGQTDSGISNSVQHQTEGFDTAASKVSIWTSMTFGDIKIYRA